MLARRLAIFQSAGRFRVRSGNPRSGLGRRFERGGDWRPNVPDWREISRQDFRFFSPAVAPWPRPDRSRRPSSPAHLFRQQAIRPGRPRHECRNRRKKRPAGKGWRGSFRRTVSDAMSKRQQRKLRPCVNPRAVSETPTTFEARFLAQRRFSRAIPGTMSLFRRNSCDNVQLVRLNLAKCPGKNRVLGGFVSKREKRAQARAAILPAIVGRNARLRAYWPDTIAGRARWSENPQRGIDRSARNDLSGCRKHSRRPCPSRGRRGARGKPDLLTHRAFAAGLAPYNPDPIIRKGPLGVVSLLCVASPAGVVSDNRLPLTCAAYPQSRGSAAWSASRRVQTGTPPADGR